MLQTLVYSCSDVNVILPNFSIFIYFLLFLHDHFHDSNIIILTSSFNKNTPFMVLHSLKVIEE